MQADLIYDLGFHKGEDADFYLRKGYRVVAVEGSPTLAAEGRARFADQIAQGGLHLIEGAIAPASAGDTIVFYENPTVSVWGTVKDDWASRNDALGHPSKRTVVKRLDMGEVFRAQGIPFYLKIDVEGVDRHILEQLAPFKDRPHYVSLESEKAEFSDLVAELETLRDLGYKKFMPVQQESIPGTRINTRSRRGEPVEHVFKDHASGPFGDDLSASWLNFADTIDAYRQVFTQYRRFGDTSTIKKLPSFAERVVRKLYRLGSGHKGPLPGWFDTHASL